MSYITLIRSIILYNRAIYMCVYLCVLVCVLITKLIIHDNTSRKLFYNSIFINILYYLIYV